MSGRLWIQVVALVFWLLAPPVWAGVRGVVRHSDDGRPLRAVTVFLAETAHRAETDSEGWFIISGVPPGNYLLVAAALGFGRVKKPIQVISGQETELDILLTPGTQIRDEIQVAAAAEGPGPALSGTDVLQLKTILTDDALRAVQQLPGMVSNDDFNSAFAFQGSGFDRLGILLDGAPVYVFLHTIEGEEDSGSTSLLSADLIDSIELVPGGSSAEWGATSAGFLRLDTRNPAASSGHSLISVSGSAAMGLAEGRSGQTSWLLTARQSYVDWIVQRIDPGIELNFGFHDAFGKLVRSGRKDTVSFSFLHGRTGLTNARDEIGINSIDRGRLQSNVAHLQWSRVFSDRVSMDSHLSWQRGHSLNRNREGALLWDSRTEVLGARSVWRFRPRPGWFLNSGLTLEQWRGARLERRFPRRNGPGLTLSDFEERTGRLETFAEVSWTPHGALSLEGGASWARQSLGPRSYLSPYLGLRFSPGGRQTLLFSIGRTHQFPFFHQLFGSFGEAGLDPETAEVVQGRWIYRLSPTTSLDLSAYRRRRRDVPWKTDALWRVVGGRIEPPGPALYANHLSDRSSGGALQLAHQSPSGLNLRAGYGWGQSQWSEQPGIWFPGNHDQRHSLLALTGYRWSPNLDLSLRWRYGSGLPVPLYARRAGDRYFLSSARNQVRAAAYSRLDARLARAFDRDRFRLTLFVEVLNLLNRRNERFSGLEADRVNPAGGQLPRFLQRQFPILPTAGLVAEF